VRERIASEVPAAMAAGLSLKIWATRSGPNAGDFGVDPDKR